MEKRAGILMVISAPSGAGKRTVIQALRAKVPDIEMPISATTRAPRDGETPNKDYFFLSAEEFERHRDAGHFAEWAEVHGNQYGTLHTELDRCLRAGNDVILELDVQGMRNLKRLRPEAVSVFIMAPDLGELERRLRARGTDSDEVIALRLKNARAEMAANTEFDYNVINEEVARAAGDLEAILRAERCRPHRMG